jgi:hypothetical protein
MRPSGHPPRRSAIVAGLAAVALVLGLIGPVLGHGGGSSGPTYRADVAPTGVAAGTGSTSTVTLTQLVEDDSYGNKELGSVRITPPAGFSISGASAARGATVLPVSIASGAVTVNNVDLHHAGQTATVSVQATIPCGTAGSAVWTVVAHSTDLYSNSHAKVRTQDPASALTSQVAPCSLGFAAQPAAAGTGQTITSVAADPSGSPVKVQLRDGNGAPAAQPGVTIDLAITPGSGTSGAVLGGTVSAATGTSGLASFAPTVDRAGHDYRLDASAGPGIAPATSSAFDVSDVAKVCSGACSGSDTQGDTTATVSATSNGGVLAMSLGLDEVDCNNAVNKYYVATSQTVSFSVTPATGRTTITIKLAAASVDRPFLKYEVCFSSPNSTFVNKYGKTIPAGDAGILPWCLNCLHPTGGPCVLLKWFDRDGNVYVKFSVPSGDPRGKI